MSKYLEFETERLLMRPTNLEDAPFLLQVLNMPKWLKFIGDRDVTTVEEAEEYIRSRMFPQLEKLGYSNCTVIRKEDGVKLGFCGLYDREGLEGVDIGFAFLPQYEGMGYGYESAAEIMKESIRHFNIKKISGITVKENIPSQRLLEKLGLSFQKMVLLPGETEEIMLFTWKAED